jgi:N-methylhydantoinase A
VRKPVEVVNLRLRMVAAGEPYTPAYRDPVPGDGLAACYAERPLHFAGRSIPARLYRRQGLAPGDVIEGPAMITEYTSATVLPPGCCAKVDGFLNLVISVTESGQGDENLD